MSYHVSLGYSTLMYLIQDMTEELAPTVEIILYDYFRCSLIEYNEFLALMETYRFRLHDLDVEVS